MSEIILTKTTQRIVVDHPSKRVRVINGSSGSPSVPSNLNPAIPTFANAAARDSTYSTYTPASMEGYEAYLLAENLKQRHNGTSWVGSNWAAFPFTSGWSNYDSSHPLQYKISQNGMVFLRGIAKKSSTAAVNDIVGTLPAGFRTSSLFENLYVVPAAFGFALVSIRTNGQCVLTFISSGALPATYLGFDPIHFDTT